MISKYFRIIFQGSHFSYLEVFFKCTDYSTWKPMVSASQLHQTQGGNTNSKTSTYRPQVVQDRFGRTDWKSK